MDGGLSFVEQGCESKRPGNEVKIFRSCDKLLIGWDQYSGTRRANVLGRIFFGSVSFVRAKEMNSPSGETTG